MILCIYTIVHGVHQFTKEGVRMKLTFAFDEQLESNLQVVNQALWNMPLSALKIENMRGSASKEEQFKFNQVTSVRYWYNLMELTLEMTLDDDGDIYRFDSEVTTSPYAPDSNQYMEQWRFKHPDRIPRIMQCISYDQGQMFAYIIVSHQKPFTCME